MEDRGQENSSCRISAIKAKTLRAPGAKVPAGLQFVFTWNCFLQIIALYQSLMIDLKTLKIPSGERTPRSSWNRSEPPCAPKSAHLRDASACAGIAHDLTLSIPARYLSFQTRW